MEDLVNSVNLGDHVIIQRKSYMKIQKVTSKGIVNLGNDKVHIGAIVGRPLWTTFKMEPIPKSRREFKLTECTDINDISEAFITDSGADNRDILDDGCSQKLSKNEIIDLRDSGCSSQEILGQLVENSKSFLNKTEYSQEKYLKKKEKKYFDFITIRKPTVRLVFDVLYKLDATKLLGLRTDTLSQLSTAVDMHSDRTYLLYESGCQGVVTAAMLNCIAEGGNLIHIHPGNTPQKQAVQAMNFSEQQMERLLSVNIYSLLRKLRPEVNIEIEQDLNTEKVLCQADQLLDESKGDLNLVIAVDKLLSSIEGKPHVLLETEDLGLEVDGVDSSSNKRKLSDVEEETRPPKKPRWELVTENAASMLRTRKADGLVIVAKEHPTNIVKSLLPWVGMSMPFVVFSLYREPLQELYMYLKANVGVTGLRLTESWLRAHQVLPSRTHPDVTMSGGGGYILTGITVNG